MISRFINTGMVTIISFVVSGVYFGILIAVMIFFICSRDDDFGELKVYFRLNKFYNNYYLCIHIMQRIAIGLLLGLAGKHYYSGIISSSILVVHVVCIGIFRPYGLFPDNFRSMFVMLAGAVNLILCIYLVLKKRASSSFGVYCPFVILGILCLVVFVSLVFVVMHIKRLITIYFGLLADNKRI